MTDQITHLMVGAWRFCSDEGPRGVGWSWESRDRITCERCRLLVAVAEANSIPIPHDTWSAGAGGVFRRQIERFLP